MPADLSTGKKLAFAAVAIAGVLLALEGIARLAVPPSTAPSFEEHGRLIRVIGLPALNDVMEFDPTLFWRLKPELRAFPVVGRIGKTPVDFRVTTHAGLRSPPVPTTKGRFRVLALGDSCTFGLGVEDGATWPAQLEGALREVGLDAEVVNAGVPGYTAYQGMKLLETRGLTLEPDLVVVAFGFNDADLGMPQSDYETAALLAKRGGVGALLARSRLADALRRAAVKPPAPRERPRLDGGEFVATLARIKELCDARGIGMLAVIWPYEGQIRARSREYAKHQVYVARFCGERGVAGVDLISAFLTEGGPLYIDHIHASPHGCGVAARAILPWILARQPRD